MCSLFKHGGCVLTLTCIALTYMLNRCALNGHPCRKRFKHKKNCVHLFPSLTADDEVHALYYVEKLPVYLTGT